MYSQICYDIASFGFIVAATEHREGSACMSRYYDEPVNNNKSMINWIDHRRCEKEENEYSLRNRQVHLRAKEVSRTLNILLDLSNGKEVPNIFQNETKGVQPAAFASGENHPFNLSQFKDAMDVTQPVISGHSFGGATTILAMAEDKRFKMGVALDAWLFPVKEEDLSAKIEQPLLFVNTESFLNKRNLKKMAEMETPLIEGLAGERNCLLIKGTVHQNHLDLPFLMQHNHLKKVLGLHSQTCPETVMSLNNKIMVQFFLKHLDGSADAEIDEEISKNTHLIQEGFGFSDDTPTTAW